MLSNDPKRRAEIAVIHIAKKELGLEDDEYREIARRVSARFRKRDPVDSSALMWPAERAAMLQEMHDLGFRAPANRKPPAPGSRQEAKIRELWRLLNECGALRDSSEKALAAFIKRQTRGAQYIPQWLTAEQANDVIEGLKAWHRRVKDGAGDGGGGEQRPDQR